MMVATSAPVPPLSTEMVASSWLTTHRSPLVAGRASVRGFLPTVTSHCLVKGEADMIEATVLASVFTT